MNPCRTLLSCAGVFLATLSFADWPQWRGPDRSGFISADQIVDHLPADGIEASWKLDSFPGGNSGGWSSPVISGDKVYVYAHTKTKVPGVEKGESKYPWLPPEKRVGMTDEEYKEYEIKRRDENERQAKAFEFQERLVCLNLQSGEPLWDRKIESKYTRFTQSGTPCVANGRVFVLGAERTARCYDAETGEVIWSVRVSGDFRDEFFASSFVVEGGVALVACGPLVALDVQDGKLLWQGTAPLDYQSHSSPAIWRSKSESIAIVNTEGGTTRAYQISDGKPLWSIKTGTGQSSPIVAGDLMLAYGSSRKNGLSAYRLNAEAIEKEPELAWRFQGAADSGSCPAVCGDAIFVQGEKRLAKVRLSDGEKVWQKTLKISSPKYTSLIAVGDQVIYGWEGLLSVRASGEKFETLYDAKLNRDGLLIGTEELRAKLTAAQADSDGQAEFEKVWKRNAIDSGPLACSTPAFSDGRMVIRLKDAVVCYDLRK